jgi:ribosome-binding protein aMBF1 (putative translation factor)
MKPEKNRRGGRPVRRRGAPRTDVEPLCWALACVIRLWREKYGVNLEELERRSGVSRQMIGYIESQVSVCTTDILAKLARGMGMAWDDLLKLARLWLELNNPFVTGSL